MGELEPEWEGIIREIDEKLIDSGLNLSQRHFQAHLQFFQRIGYSGDISGTPESDFVEGFYNQRYPSGNFGIGSLGVGGVAYLDQIYVVRIPIVYGSVEVNLMKLADLEGNSIENIHRESPGAVEAMAYTISDLFDAAHGADALASKDGYQSMLIKSASSHLESAVGLLKWAGNTIASHENIHLSVELSLKAVLSEKGVDKAKLRGYGHNLRALAEAVCNVIPSWNDDAIIEAASAFPNFVSNRYEPSLRRIDLVRLLVRSEYIIGSVLSKIIEHPPSKEFGLHRRFDRPPLK